MSEIRHRDRILEAIDQLRKRKARPDVNRICSFMFRRFAVNCIETKLDLQKLIDAEIVIKVDYKGNTSYRNAAKWAMLPSYKYKKEIDTSSLISSAVAELIVLEPDYLDIGVPQFELEAHMMQKDSKRFSKKNIEMILKREVEIGSLVRFENGNYFIGEHLPKNSNSTMSRPSASNVGSTASASGTSGSPNNTSKTPNLSSKQTSSPSPKQNKPKPPPPPPVNFKQNENSSNSNDSDNVKSEDIKMKNDDSLNNSSNESNNVGYRVGGRQKRARVVFDPSDNNLPTRSNKKRGPGRPMGSLNKSTILSQQNNNNNNNHSNSSSRSTTPTLTTPTATQAGNKSSRPTSPTPSPAPITSPRTSVSTGSQVKTFNKNFDIGSTPPVNPNLCSICHSYGIRIKGVPERLVACSDCTRPTRAHPSCLEGSTEGSWSCDRDGTWKCGNCKTCRVCDETSQAGALVVCVVCRDAYHYNCHSPAVPERSRTRLVVWYCASCRPAPPPDAPPIREAGTRESASTREKEKVDPPLPAKREERVSSATSASTSTSAATSTSTSASREVPADCLQEPFQDIPIDESIPDAKHWSTNQVYQYFCQQMKPEIAQVFKDQDIDGQSLLLMQRMDVLTGLSLKLGPALKVYGHIRKLQTRKSHLRILWS